MGFVQLAAHGFAARFAPVATLVFGPFPDFGGTGAR